MTVDRSSSPVIRGASAALAWMNGSGPRIATATSDRSIAVRERSRQRVTAAYVAIVSLVVLVLSTPGINDEGVVAISDMPRYLMDGAFVRDVLVNAPTYTLRDFTASYYIRYPAIGLGHYAPLTAGIEAIAFLVLGVSVFSARIAMAACMLAAAWGQFFLVRRIYDEHIAFVATLLFVTTASVVSLARVVQAEIPALALILLSTWALQAYCRGPAQGRLFAFVAFAVASVYAKHTSVLFFPAYAAQLWRVWRARPEFRPLMSRAAIAGVLLLVPMVLLTIRFAPAKLELVVHSDLSVAERLAGFLATASDHASPVVLACGVLALVVALVRHDRRPLLFVGMIGVYYLGISVTASIVISRYSVYWVPAFCALAASLLAVARPGQQRALVATALVALAALQGGRAFVAPPPRAEGYEAAARFVVAHKTNPVILYSAGVDSGLLPFFVRALDPDRNLVVLRADKVLATSSMDRIVADRISAPWQVHDVLKRFGIRHVVIEDVAYDSPALRWLQQEVLSSRFRLLTRIPVRSSAPRLAGASLSVYEYVEATPLPSVSRVRVDLPLSRTSIDVDLHEVLRTRIR